MAYVNGSAATFADLKTAIENAAVAAGWTLTSGILSKNGCFFQLTANQVTNPYLRLQGGTGQSGSTLTGVPAVPQANAAAMIASCQGNVMTFPITYEIHTFTNPDEVHCVINYNSDFYQTLAFGKSDIPGIGGTGAWFTGNYNSAVSLTSTSNARVYMSVSQTVGLASPYSGQGLPYFVHQSTTGTTGASSWVHHGLDNVNWRTNSNRNAASGLSGIDYAMSLLTSLPNLSNQATILIPVKAVAIRNNGGLTIVANPKNVRYCRMDNIVPGEIVTFGADQWKCYPFHRKDATQRDGVTWTTGALHTGTWGFAIRYTGS